MTHPLPHGPMCLSPWSIRRTPKNSVLDAAYLPNGLVLCRVANGTSGKQISWRWSLLSWNTSRSAPSWEVVGQVRKAVGHAHQYRWWVRRLVHRPTDPNPHWEKVEGIAYDELAAKTQMLHMATEIYQ